MGLANFTSRIYEGLMPCSDKKLIADKTPFPNHPLYLEISFAQEEEIEDAESFRRAFDFSREHLFHRFGVNSTGRLDKLNEGYTSEPIAVHAYIDRVSNKLGIRDMSEVVVPIFFRPFFKQGKLIIKPDLSLEIPRKSVDELLELKETYSQVSRPRDY